MATKTEEVIQDIHAEYFKARAQHLRRLRTKPKGIDYRLKWHRSDIATDKLLNEIIADIDIPFEEKEFNEYRRKQMREVAQGLLRWEPYLTVDELYVYLTGVYHGFSVGWNKATDKYVQWVPAKRGR